MAKKKASSKVERTLSWVKTHKTKTLFLVILVVIAGTFSYNKYLDYRNVQDMKQLLADFEQLEKDVEAETGEDLNIEADCSSVGKFATSYACSTSLLGSNELLSSSAYELPAANYIKSHERCEILFHGKNDYKNALYCNIHVRNSNREKSEEIFYQYDTSPGQTF